MRASLRALWKARARANWRRVHKVSINVHRDTCWCGHRAVEHRKDRSRLFASVRAWSRCTAEGCQCGRYRKR